MSHAGQALIFVNEKLCVTLSVKSGAKSSLANCGDSSCAWLKDILGHPVNMVKVMNSTAL